MRRPFLSLLFLGLIAIGVSLWMLSYMYQSASAADSTVSITSDALTQDSGISTKDGKTVFSLRSNDGQLYRPRQKGAAGVYEFLQKRINARRDASITLQNLPKNLEPDKIFSDSEDPLLKRFGKNENRKHYYFKQKVEGLEVFGSQVAVHQKDDAHIYAFTGALVQDESLEQTRLTEMQAQTIAVNEIKKDSTVPVEISSVEKVALNQQLLGMSEDTKTYPALVVTTNQMVGGLEDPKRTIVSMTDGSIIQSIELADYAVSRQVYNCNENPSGSCSLARTEGSAASGVAEVDNMYTYIGESYAFYKAKMNRDSYDNRGSTTKAFVNLPATINGEKICPNARWIHAGESSENQLQVCPGWGPKDVVAHEFTHGVVEYTANFDFENQAGALNEATADIFATGIDDDWSIGEDLSIGAIRFIDDPSKNRSPNSAGGTNANPMPDRLFATQYYCGDGDRGGVHRNMSVPTKAFYLMVVGGTFNGCTMNGIGKDKALLIWYQAITKYMSTTSNFREMYNAANQGCTDLYGATSTECTQVKKSMQAVEMDQQPLSSQMGPKCSGITAQTPTCVGATEPTVTPVPPTNTPAVATNTPVPPTPTGGTCSQVQGDANHDGRVNLTDFAVWRSAFLAR